MEKVTKGIILVLLLVLFAILAYYSHSENLLGGTIDQGNYMSNAINLKEQGGSSNFLKLCLTGKYTEANRHPLFIILLSTFASRDIHFFIKAKILATFMAFIFFIVFFVIVQKEFGFLISAISLSLLVMSDLFVQHYSMVACEYTLIIFTFLTWYFTTKGFDNNKLWVWGGVFNGLAYMSKSVGILFLANFILVYLIISLKNNSLKISLKNRYFFLYILAFVIVSFPLLARNTIVYKNPFFNKQGKIMWLDNASEWLSDDLISQAGMVKYFKTHSLKVIVKRFIFGVKNEFFVFINSFGGNHYFFGSYLRIRYYLGIYFLILLLAITFLNKDNNSNRRIYNLTLFCIFYSVFSFLNVLAGMSRYYMPLTSIIIIYSGIGINNIFDRFVRKILPYKYSSGNLALVLLAVSLGLVNFRTFNYPDISFSKGLDKLYAYAPGEEKLALWMKENLKDSDVVMQTTVLYPYLLPVKDSIFYRIKGSRFNIPPAKDFKALTTYMKEKRATYVILNCPAIFMNGSFMYLFKDYIEFSGKGFSVQALPPGWKLIYSDPDPHVNFLVFKICNGVPLSS